MTDKKVDRDTLYTEAQAADLLKMTPRMLAERRRAGKIGHIKDGRFIVFAQQHLDEYRRAHQRRGVYADQPSDTERLLDVVSRHLGKVTASNRVDEPNLLPGREKKFLKPII